MTPAEEKTADAIAKIIQSQGEINCTACKYCLEVCPLGINIPAAFSLYNNYKVNGQVWTFTMMYETLDESERPDKCIKCGACLKNCPQSLKIPDLLAKVADLYKQLKR